MRLDNKSLAIKAIIIAKKRLNSLNKTTINNCDEIISIIKSAINKDDVAS